MMTSTDIDNLLDVLAKVLIRCFILGMVALILAFVVYMIASRPIIGIHSSLFGLSEQSVILMYYYGMALVKLIVFMFFLIPYIAIRMVLAKRR